LKIGIQTWGSRGDVMPFIALGHGLQSNGHEVILYYTCFTNVDFKEHEAEHFTIESTKQFCPDTTVYENIPYNGIFNMEVTEGFIVLIDKIYSRFNEEIISAGEYLCQQCDVVIVSNLLYQLPSLAQKYNLPIITIHVDSNFFDYDENLEPILNSIYRDRVNEFRRTLGLPDINNARAEVFCSSGLNLIIFSKIFGTQQEHWGKHVKVTGFLENKNINVDTVPDELNYFLKKDEPPVFFSIGSAAFLEVNKKEILDLFIRAIRLSGCRAIIQADWENITYTLPSDLDIYPVSYIPHNYIFPSCCCVVHHGGTGATHATLSGGCPSVVMAYAWDQFVWGRRLVLLGAAPGLLKRATIDEVQLAGNIRSIMANPEYKYSAESIRRKLKRENGVAKAVKYIEEYALSTMECANESNPKPTLLNKR
jgi:sterol 3beta-glucosyltransferase